MPDHPQSTRRRFFEHMPYGELMDDLSSAWRRADAPEYPATDDGYWVHTLQMVFDELEALGLSKPIPKPEPKKRAVNRSQKTKPNRRRSGHGGRLRKNPIRLPKLYSPADWKFIIEMNKKLNNNITLSPHKANIKKPLQRHLFSLLPWFQSELNLIFHS